MRLAADKIFRQGLRENNIPAYIIFPVFYNPPALAADTTLFAVTDQGKLAMDEWVEFGPEMNLPSIQVYGDANSASFDREMFAACIEEALEPPSLGVVFWSSPLFEKDTPRMDIAKAAVDNISKRLPHVPLRKKI